MLTELATAVLAEMEGYTALSKRWKARDVASYERLAPNLDIAMLPPV